MKAFTCLGNILGLKGRQHSCRCRTVGLLVLPASSGRVSGGWGSAGSEAQGRGVWCLMARSVGGAMRHGGVDGETLPTKTLTLPLFLSRILSSCYLDSSSYVAAPATFPLHSYQLLFRYSLAATQLSATDLSIFTRLVSRLIWMTLLVLALLTCTRTQRSREGGGKRSGLPRG